MERDQRRRRARTIDAPRRIVSITDGMLQIRRLHHLADILELAEQPKEVRKLQLAALNVAVKVVRLAAENDRDRQLLDATLQRLKNSDFEMHGRLDDVLKQARAVGTTAEAV